MTDDGDDKMSGADRKRRVIADEGSLIVLPGSSHKLPRREKPKPEKPKPV